MSTMPNLLNPYSQLYGNPAGPGDARPTALQIIHDNNLVDQWTGKTVLVTGATSGLGLETARALHATGANVFITARNLEKAATVIADIKSSSSGSGLLEAVEMDMTSLASVKRAAAAFLAKSPTLHVLIANAGIMALPERTLTEDGHEAQFAVCHLAHFTLTLLLLPAMLKASTTDFNSRVVTLTSNGHSYSPVNLEDPTLEADYDPWRAYGQAKTANIWMANRIDRVYGPKGVHALSVHPGGALTGLQKNLPKETLEAWGGDGELMRWMMAPAQGAATATWAAVAPVWEGKGGKYLFECKIGEEAKDLTSIMDQGYAPHAFDEEREDRLWEMSLAMVGVEDVN
ncbi:hypothetical protein ACHAQH_002546 [Verticillium albo-atrum]